MKTLSQVQVEQRARRLSERKFSEGCTRYETVLSSVEISAGEQQLCSDDIVKTWNLQEKQDQSLFKL